VTILVGLFSRTPRDLQIKDNIQKFKELKKLVKEKKYTAALKLGTEYLEKNPNHHDVLFIVGGIHYMKNNHETAISYFDRSLEIGSHDLDVLFLKAYSHQKLGENKRVIQCCDKIREIDPKNKAVSELLEQLNS
jgi:tetratricopeptide (TPR) repeat protein